MTDPTAPPVLADFSAIMIGIGAWALVSAVWFFTIRPSRKAKP